MEMIYILIVSYMAVSALTTFILMFVYLDSMNDIYDPFFFTILGLLWPFYLILFLGCVVRYIIDKICVWY